MTSLTLLKVSQTGSSGDPTEHSRAVADAAAKVQNTAVERAALLESKASGFVDAARKTLTQIKAERLVSLETAKEAHAMALGIVDDEIKDVERKLEALRDRRRGMVDTQAVEVADIKKTYEGEVAAQQRIIKAYEMMSMGLGLIQQESVDEGSA